MLGSFPPSLGARAFQVYSEALEPTRLSNQAFSLGGMVDKTKDVNLVYCPLYSYFVRLIITSKNNVSCELQGQWALELAFETRELRDICENESKAAETLGAIVSEALKHRLADMVAATNPGDLLAGCPRVGTDTSKMIIELEDDYVLVFASNHVRRRNRTDGHVDWAKVSRVRILEIRRRNGN